MTEQQWQEGGDVKAMIDHLRGGVSERKHRLFNVACCRRAWHLYRKPAVRDAILTGERCADGADREQLRAALRSIHAERARAASGTPEAYALQAAGFTAAELNPTFPFLASSDSMYARMSEGGADVASVAAHERIAVCSLLREFFGNPFRPVALDPRWLSESVTALARGVYDEHGFDAMPILADALEDAGCSDAEVLGHCRGGGPHYRGCWVLDLLLGKG